MKVLNEEMEETKIELPEILLQGRREIKGKKSS
jgi:hypothetical protein